MAIAKYIGTISPRRARGRLAAVYRQCAREFGLVPGPIRLHSIDERLAAACWAVFRETVQVSEFLDRSAKEALATAISRKNSCQYCAVAHSAILGGLGLQEPAAACTAPALTRYGAAALREIVDAIGAERHIALQQLPAPALSELIGTACLFEYINRMVNVFLDVADLPIFLPRPLTFLQGPYQRMVTRVMGHYARRKNPAGLSLEWIETGDAAAAPDWARPVARIAAAFAAMRGILKSLAQVHLTADFLHAVAAMAASTDTNPPAPQPAATEIAWSVMFQPQSLTAQRLQAFQRENGDTALFLSIAWPSFSYSLALAQSLARNLAAPGSPAPASGT